GLAKCSARRLGKGAAARQPVEPTADSIASQQQPGVAYAGATGRHVFCYCRAWLLGFDRTVVDLHSNSRDDPGLATCDAWRRSGRRQPNSAKLISANTGFLPQGGLYSLHPDPWPITACIHRTTSSHFRIARLNAQI